MSDMSAESDILILIPVFNDWEAVAMLLELLDRAMMEIESHPRVLLVDDGSTEPVPPDFDRRRLEWIRQIDVLGLRRNLGHQRALAIGLCWVEAKIPCRAVVIMDGDGEDAPEDVPRLLRAFAEKGERTIVFAERTRRSESWWFAFLYHSYRLLHYILTGVRVRVGNFSVIPVSLLSRLVVVSDLWNHYAAAVFKARLSHDTIPTQRGRRLSGRSRMDFVALVTHGLSAISVFGDRVGVRLLIVTSLLAGLAVFGLVTIAVIRLATTRAIPGWATTASGLLLVILTQLFTLLLVFTLVILSGRESSSFLPTRDYVHFVAGLRRVFPSHE
jgi:polyisoprenyl-phosphate glycosyltransferase